MDRQKPASGWCAIAAMKARADRSSHAGSWTVKFFADAEAAGPGRGGRACCTRPAGKTRRCRRGGDDVAGTAARTRAGARHHDAANWVHHCAADAPDAEKRRADFVVDTSHGLDPCARKSSILAEVVKMPRRRAWSPLPEPDRPREIVLDTETTALILARRPGRGRLRQLFNHVPTGRAFTAT